MQVRFIAIVCSLVISTSILAADGDKKRPKDGRPAGPEEFLKKHDKNKDGKLSKDELPEKMAERFDRFDTDKDGYLVIDEIKVVFERLRGKDRPKEGKGAEQLADRAMKEQDTNKDGKISKDEAKRMVADHFDKIDTNKDGKVDREELKAALAKLRPEGGGGTPGKDFDALDKDADGRLTKEELKGTPWADKFNELDTNKDGKLDRKEFKAYLQKLEDKPDSEKK